MGMRIGSILEWFSTTQMLINKHSNILFIKSLKYFKIKKDENIILIIIQINSSVLLKVVMVYVEAHIVMNNSSNREMVGKLSAPELPPSGKPESRPHTSSLRYQF